MKKVIPQDAVLLPDAADLKFSGMIFDVYQWPQKLFDGTEHTFEMLKRTDTVSVIAVVDGKVLVIDDEQPHLGRRRSFPGGRVDDTDKSPLAAAQREMHEETGYSFANWRLVEVRQPYRKIEWFVHVWLAWSATGKDEPHLDAGEKIAVSLVDLSELKQMVEADSDYLGESRSLLKDVNGVEQLLALPEFAGREVDR